MRIAVEAQRIFQPNKHGVDFVALESIRELQKIDRGNEYFIAVSPSGGHCLEGTGNVHIIEVKCSTYPLWGQVALPRVVSKIRPDLLCCMSNTAPIHCPVPLVLTLHDIIFLEPRQGGDGSWYQNTRWYYCRMVVPRILSQREKIITVSHFEYNHIREALQLPEDKITTICNGYNEHFHPLPGTLSVTRKYIDDDDYTSSLSDTGPKKSVTRTLKTYSLYLKQSDKKRPLFITDLGKDRLGAILREQQIEEIKPHLSYPGCIPNKDLAYLYSGTFVLLCASLRESFGTPMLETMVCGTPIITGNTFAMPGITGEGGILANSLNTREIVEKILYLGQNQIFYQDQVKYDLNRVQRFFWA